MLLLLFAPGALLGCFPRGPARTPSEMELLSLDKREDVLNFLVAKDQEIYSFRSLARTNIIEDKKQRSIRYIFVFEKPDKLRIEALPVNMSYALHLLISGKDDESVFLDTTQKLALISRDSEKAIRQVLRIPLSKRDLLSYLTGRIPMRVVSEKLGVREARYSVEKGGGPLHIVWGESRDTWVVNQDFVLQSVKLHDPFNGKVSLEIDYGSYESLGSLIFPKTITLRLPREDLEVVLRMSSTSINGSYPDDLFIAKIPDDYEIRRR